MTQYLIKSERGWWLPKGYGYTQDRAQAGRFTLADMAAFNLDGCTLYRAEVAFSPATARRAACPPSGPLSPSRPASK
ncbi:hypothetical protein G891_04707 [Escherichia coli KOEGE 68 (182a)]|nr:hypothetical protein G891_04707 [Escherichia coli KOEGE 68 (182a)]